MIKDALNKFGGRFKKKMTTYNDHTLLPTYNLIDTFDGELFSISTDTEIIIENVLSEKIINKRGKKIDYVLNGDQTKENRTSKSNSFQ